jgi:ketosteroid isomerase-like protein
VNDKEKIIKLYHDMYAAMVAKDEEELRRVHDDSFVLIHMTGMNQSKEEYIRAIMNGTLNYYSEQTDHIDVDIEGDQAIMIGNSRVSAAVFGGRRHTWRQRRRWRS